MARRARHSPFCKEADYQARSRAARSTAAATRVGTSETPAHDSNTSRSADGRACGVGAPVHLLCEADGPRALANGVRAVTIRLAKRFNARMGRDGPVFADRYHVHVLRTPAEVRNALAYVLGNHARHARAWGEKVPERWVDPCTSAWPRAPRAGQLSLFAEPVTQEARTWLLRTAGRRKGAG